MKSYPWKAIAVLMTLPSCCLAQTWQRSTPERMNQSAADNSSIHDSTNPGSGNRFVVASPNSNVPRAMLPGATITDSVDDESVSGTPAIESPNYEMPQLEASVNGTPGLDGGCGIDGGCGSMEGDGACNVGCTTECCRGGGTYFSIFGGLADLNTQDSTGFQRDLQIQYDQGYGLGAAIGRRVSRCFRTELEYVYRSQTPAIVNFNGTFPNNVNGQQSSHAGMVNLVYDMLIGKGNLVPYFGGGIGVAGVDSQVRYGNMGMTLNGDDSALAAQWMAGLTYRARPNMEMFVEYRFFEIDDPKLNRFGGPPINNNPANVILDSEYVSNDVFFGFRFNF